MYDPDFLKVDSAAPRRLDEHLTLNGKNGSEEELTLKDVLADPHAPDPSEGHPDISRSQLFGMVASLPDREFRVVTLRYFGGMRLSEIATNMSLSETRISQIEGMALTRLRSETTP
jgi:RNA polymerase sigma-B factor